MYTGTVAHNTVAKSPVKEHGSSDTPEWRRRLVKGEIGYGDQKDLFGPTGLENIFQKPNGAPSEETQSPKRKLGLLKGLAAMPSSPPPWPAAAQELDQSVEEPEEGSTSYDDVEIQREDSPLEDAMQAPDESITTHAARANTQEPSRTISGQIEFENESFSPVYLTTNLKVGQTPEPIPNFRGSELANRLRQIGSPPPAIYEPVTEESVLSQERGDSSFARTQDYSLPEGLPSGTPDVSSVGHFVELRRGGYSREGSFRTRPLSPSPGKLVSSSTSKQGSALANAPQNDSQLSSPVTEATPKTPSRKVNHFLSPERAKNSGSPLKLFDAHDTFTSNRLQRRLSQLEYKSDKTIPSSIKESEEEPTKPMQKTSRLPSVEEISMQNDYSEAMSTQRHHVRQRVGTFGEGQLSSFQFSGDFSADSSEAFDAQDESAPDGSPSMDVAPPGSRQPFRFQLDESPVSRKSSRASRQVSGSMRDSIRHVSRPKFHSHRKQTLPMEEEDESIQEYAEGKRGPTSPFKNPTPKRRRTIHSVEDDDEDDEDVFSESDLGTVQRSHTPTQSIISRKQKDARHDSNNVANAETLARRHILRPRNPTPSQRRKEEIHAEIMEATEAFIMSSPKLNTIREQLEPSITADIQSERVRAKAVAKQVAAFSMKRQRPARDESRKRSVTTQDFLDEAVKIMDFIRTKGRPTSGLGSLEETEAESEFIEETTEHASSSLTLERPPSREGRLSAWQEPSKQQLNPNIMSHLQKYQEKESDIFLNSSVNSIRFSRMRGPATPEGESVIVEQNDIRITDNPNRYPRDDDLLSRGVEFQPRTSRTQPSSGSSLGHTLATNASRRSDFVATLPPEAVAHLIPQQIAGMSFDREKNMWVRQKSPSKEHRRLEEDHSGWNESEEDPFGHIPDLTIDETKEQKANGGSARAQPTVETFLEDTDQGVAAEERRPVTREGKGTAFADTSSAPSKASNFGWSYPKTETRATSWSTQAPRNHSTQKTPHVQTTYAIPESDEDDIEHEIKYFEGRERAPPSMQHRRVRDITISIAERQVQGSDNQPADTPQDASSDQWQPATTQHNLPKKSLAWQQMYGTKALPQTLTNHMPMFNGDGDLSILDELPSKNYRMQLSMSVSAPGQRQGGRDTLVVAPTSPLKGGDVTFMLSDLPEFTLNQIDEYDIPDRVIVKHDGSRFSKALEDRYAQGTADLVKALQDVEPDEPYWEDIRRVNLHKKDLSTLHRLDELCYQLEELDVSDNKLNQVEGVPYSMRRLQAQNNCLTGLTSWTTLVNLQHLDISGNNIDGLDGLAELVHLRILKADNNKIKSLTGVLHLDGLMELSAGGNQIETVDFARTDL